MGRPFRKAPCPFTAHQVSFSMGQAVMPKTGPSCSQKAAVMPTSGMPCTKLVVPSMGSTIQHLSGKTGAPSFPSSATRGTPGVTLPRAAPRVC